MLSLGGGLLPCDFFASTGEVATAETVAATAAAVKTTQPNSLTELQNASDLQIDEWAKLNRFDGRKYNYVTPQRSQIGQLCWAYATTGLAEVSILRQGLGRGETYQTLDFDDRHLAWSTVNRQTSLDPLLLTKDDVTDYPIEWNGPGYLKDACLALSNGYAPIPEQENGNYQKDMQSDYIAEQVIKIENKPEEIKKAILKYGGVGFAYLAGTYNAYMCSQGIANHASVIVGWDDSVDKSLFYPNTPENNGAWIVKNSWGEAGGTDPVNNIRAYYVSYENTQQNFYAVDMALKSDYPNIYRYDGSPINSPTSIPDIEASAAIFEAKLSDAANQEYLDAVSLAFVADDVDLEINIYKIDVVNPGNVNDSVNNPEQGVPIVTQYAKFSTAGSYTVKLDSKVPLEQGDYFSIVVKDRSGKDIRLTCALDINSVNDMTYYCLNGKWKSYKNSDSLIYANEADNKMSARIRAITQVRSRETPQNEKNLKYARVEFDSRLIFYEKDQEQVPQITVTLGERKLVQGIDYKLDIANNSTPGRAIVTITGQNGYFGTRTTSFEVAKPYRPQNLPPNHITAYNDVNLLEDIGLPTDWTWLDPSMQLREGENSCTLKYIGQDAIYYQNLFYDVRVTKINEQPPEKINIVGAQVEISGEYTYSGRAIVPKLTVKYGDSELFENFDYTLSFDNNVNAGKAATVHIKGIGRYTGELDAAFEIKKAERPNIMPESTMKVSRKIERLSQIDLPFGWSWQTDSTLTDEPFTATAEYFDTNNYAEFTVEITVTRAEKVALSDVTVTYVQQPFVYNGRPIQPTVEANDGPYSLVRGVDFNVQYQNNTAAGSGTVIVTGTGDYYEGEVRLTFEIAKANREGFAVNMDGWAYGEVASEPACTGEEESAAVKYEYCSEQYGQYSDAKPKDAGNYYVRATIQSSQNYDEAVAYASFTISRAVGRMSATVANWTFGESANKPNVSSDTNPTTNPIILYRKSNVGQFSSAVPVDAGEYEMKIVLQESKNYTACEQILSFEILKAEKPKDVPSTVNVSPNAKTLGDVALPTGWKWENPDLAIDEETKKATIVRIDEENYVQSRFQTELCFMSDTEQPTDKTNGLNALWWGLGITGGASVAAAAIWLALKAKKKL